jgi:hypothetical protein
MTAWLESTTVPRILPIACADNRPARAVLLPYAEQQDGADQRHESDHEEDGCVGVMVHNSGQQGKEQSAQSSGHPGEAGSASDALLRKEIGDGPEHICRKKVIGHHGDTNQQECGGHTGQIGNSQTDQAQQAAAVHGDAPHIHSPDATLLQPSGSPASRYPSGVSEKKWKPPHDADLGKR